MRHAYRVMAWLFSSIYVGFPVHGHDSLRLCPRPSPPHREIGCCSYDTNLRRRQVLFPWFQPTFWVGVTGSQAQSLLARSPSGALPASQIPRSFASLKHHTADLTTKHAGRTYHHRPIVNDPHLMTSPRQYNARTKMTPSVVPRRTKHLIPPTTAPDSLLFKQTPQS